MPSMQENGESAVRLAKYLTWWFIKQLVSRCCVANLTCMLQTSSFNQTHVLVASNSISLSCLEGRIYIITVLNPLPVLIILLNQLPGSRYTLKILREILSFTRSFMINTHPLRSWPWVSRKLRPKSKTISCYTLDCFKSSCLLVWKCLVLNCHETDIALTERLGSNGFVILSDKFCL